MQAFKIIVTDPDTVLNTLTREVKEIGPDGQEVNFFCEMFYCTFFLLMTKAVFKIVLKVTKVVPALSEEVKDSLIKNMRRRMTPQPLKIRADIEMKCFQFDGVLHIKVLFFALSMIGLHF